MIRTIFIGIATVIFFTACNKKDTATTVVQYQVVATNSSKIDIVYNNVIENKTSVIATDSWTFDIINPQRPFTAYIKGASVSPFSSITTDCTVNILVNGSIVKTTTVASNTVATAEAEFVVQ